MATTPITQVLVDVTVDDVEWKANKYCYEGDFTYTQTSPPYVGDERYVKPKGKIDIRKLPNDAEVVFNWQTPTVTSSDSKTWNAELLIPSHNSVRLAVYPGPKPVASAPISGSEVSVPNSGDTKKLAIFDKGNGNGKRFKYNLLVWLYETGKKAEGILLIDDPIIENRSGPPGLTIRPIKKAKPKKSARPKQGKNRP